MLSPNFSRLPRSCFIVWLSVFLRIVANPLSNVFQKALTQRAADPLFIICATHGLLSLACVVALPFFDATALPLAMEFWLNIGVAAVLAVAGNALLVQALKRADLSVLGPINAYKSVVSLIPGVIVLGELPGLVALGGIGLIVAGSACLIDRDARQPRGAAMARFFRDRGVQYRFAALILSATEAVFLKGALHASTPLATFAAWSILGFGASLVAVCVLLGGDTLRREIAGLGVRPATLYLLLAATTGLMQVCTIVVLKTMHVGSALALFQISTVLSVLLGHTFFQEGRVLQRLTGALVMAAGAALIILGDAI